VTTDNLEADLIRDEGERLRAYRDSRGIWTIGVGHDIAADPTLSPDLKRLIDPGLSQAEVEALFRRDLEDVRHELDLHLPWWRSLDDVRQDVLANMAFNLGMARLMTFASFLAFVKAGKYQHAALDMLGTLWAFQTGARARRLAAQMRTGERQA
jgi:lysozyme